MKKVIILSVVTLLFVVFVYMNWSIFIVETSISLLGYKIQAPLGLIMLGVLVLVILFSLISLMKIWMMSRKQQRELSGELEKARRATVDAVTDGGIHGGTVQKEGLQRLENTVGERAGEVIDVIETAEKRIENDLEK